MKASTRLPLALLSVVVGAAALAVLPAGPAAANDSYVFITRNTWAFTDSRAPHSAFVDQSGDAPVGAWRDAAGKTHLSKSYFTLDLSQLRGARIVSARVIGSETAAADCTRPRATELWVTDPATRPTWDNQPVERQQLPGSSQLPCLWSYLTWEATALVQQAVASGATTITLVLRNSEATQGDAAYGRRYANGLGITIAYNRAPDTPTGLTANYEPCAAEPPYLPGPPRLAATVTDPDGGLVSARFAVWPVDRPQDRTEGLAAGGSSGTVQWWVPPADVFVDDHEYAWAVRGEDETDVSAWSAPCGFRTDFVRPDRQPGVSSEVYPEGYDGGGGPGVPGEFVFTANGVSDVVGFYYGEFEPSSYVPADHLGGAATITYTPDSSGPTDLAVYSVDRAGHRSDTRRYTFWVLDPRPSVTCEPPDADLGVPRECTFTPHMEGVVSYTYRFLDDPEITVPAGADGTATVTVTPPSGDSELTVFSTTGSGVRSPGGGYYFSLDTAPTVGCHGNVNNGEPLDCTFWPNRMSDVTEYSYQLNGGPPVTVQAAADGTGHAVVTADRPGWNELIVVATSGQGLRSSEGIFQAYLFSTPVVSSAVYPFNAAGGGPGVAGEFAFAPGAMPGVVEYVYRFNGEDQAVVPAGPDGGASVTFTPDGSGWHSLTVYSRTTDGATSDWKYYPFEVSP